MENSKKRHMKAKTVSVQRSGKSSSKDKVKGEADQSSFAFVFPCKLQ
jgi:hypothetical protein